MGLRVIKINDYVPSKVFKNEDFEKIIDTSDEWIKSRTGIEQRHFVENEDTSDLALKVAEKFKEEDLSKVDVILVATFTPDYITPSIASLIQKELDIKEDTIAFDFNMACSGFVAGLKVLDSMLESNRRGIIIGAETISKVLDFSDRKTSILFGDGAAGVLVEKNDEEMFFDIGSRGDCEVLVAFGETSQKKDNKKLFMEGKEVFRFATAILTQSLNTTLEKYKIDIEEIDYFVFHQANKRIIEHVRKKFKLPEEKIFMNLQKFGNTSSASIPLALKEMSDKNILKENDRVFLSGFGGGLSWASTIIKW